MAMKKNGILISFEGSEGSGKTTQIGRLAENFEKSGKEVVVTREPGGTLIGEDIRRLLKHDKIGENMYPETELLLFSAARAQLVREVIAPALDQGKVILCDRFLDSTTVYQGMARKISQEPIQVINRFAAGELMPDLTFIFDLSAEAAMERVRHRASGLSDRIEKENIEFYQAIRKGYLILGESLPDRFVVIDAEQPMETIEKAVWGEIQQRFSNISV